MRQLLLLTLLFPFLSWAQSPSPTDRPKVGVILSGGGAKGYAHIGALKKIEEAGIKIDYIGGTSMGAIIGGLYAAGYTPEQLTEIIHELDLTALITNNKNRRDIPFFDKTYKEKYILELPFDNFKMRIPHAISSGQGPLDVLTYLFRHVHQIDDFNQLEIPFVCVATDIETGQEKVFRNGFLPKVVLASGAYPSMIEPVLIDGRMYVDGGVLNNFPAQEVKDMGADILIGVDLEDGLKKQEEITSATETLIQIITFNIAKKSAEQKKLIDLMIIPDMSGYGVTSFDQVDPIIKRGLVAGEDKFTELQAIAQRQGNLTMHRREIEDKDFFLIRRVELEGDDVYNKNYVQGKLQVKTPQLLNYTDIRDGINRLYASGNYSKVEYKLVNDDENDYTLKLFLTEKMSKQSVRFGLHYDDFFKTGLLVNFTFKNLLVRNSTLSADIVMGDFGRYNFNYFMDNGHYPSIGINSRMHKFSKEVNFNFVRGALDSDLNEINYTFKDYVTQLYVQSTLKERYAIGGGLEHQISSMFTRNIINSPSYPLNVKDRGYYWKGYAYIKADNRNNPNYPTRGIKFDGNLKYLFDSNVKDFDKIYELEASLEKNFHINNFLSYRFTANFGTFFNGNNTDPQKYIVGGYVEQRFLNYTKFYGLPFASALSNNKLVLGSHIQAKILKNHYASALINIGNFEEEFKQLSLTDYEYIGYGLGYGYDSPLGPLNFIWSYSPNTKKGLFNLSLGYWF